LHNIVVRAIVRAKPGNMRTHLHEKINRSPKTPNLIPDRNNIYAFNREAIAAIY